MHLLYAQRYNFCPDNSLPVISGVFHLGINQMIIRNTAMLGGDTEMSLTFGSTCSIALLAAWVK